MMTRGVVVDDSTRVVVTVTVAVCPSVCLFVTDAHTRELCLKAHGT